MSTWLCLAAAALSAGASAALGADLNNGAVTLALNEAGWGSDVLSVGEQRLVATLLYYLHYEDGSPRNAGPVVTVQSHVPDHLENLAVQEPLRREGDRLCARLTTADGAVELRIAAWLVEKEPCAIQEFELRNTSGRELRELKWGYLVNPGADQDYLSFDGRLGLTYAHLGPRFLGVASPLPLASHTVGDVQRLMNYLWTGASNQAERFYALPKGNGGALLLSWDRRRLRPRESWRVPVVLGAADTVSELVERVTAYSRLQEVRELYTARPLKFPGANRSANLRE
jgi:hypothetical protein